jgi:hypothetical protein
MGGSAWSSARRWKWCTVATLFVAGGAPAALVIVLVRPIRIGRISDDRLYGTWQSDADRTVAGIRDRKPVDETHEAALRKLFGKLLVTYTPTTFTTELDGATQEYKYEVLGKDKHSVVIREIEPKPTPLDALNLSEFTVIQFDGPDSYWLYTSIGGIREHFKRLR